jgi:hypothetical protein
MAEHAPSSASSRDGGHTPRLDPTALPVTYAAQVLTRVGGQRITEEMLRADIDDGAPTNADSTINLVQYAAWLVQQMNAFDDAYRE